VSADEVSADEVTADRQDGAVLLPGFDDFYRQTYARVLAYARFQAKGIADAEQALVDAYTVAAGQWDRIGQYDNPEAYVRQIVRQSLARAVGRWWKGLMVAQQSPSPVPPSDPELSAQVRAVLEFVARHLPRRQRQVLALHCLGYNSEEIAQELDMKSSTVRNHLKRARGSLRDAFGTGREPGRGQADGLAPAPSEVAGSSLRSDLLAESWAALSGAFDDDAGRMERLRAQIGAAAAGKKRAGR
jgi:RNA polymerase sigma-70 factor (ECF subfamily)